MALPKKPYWIFLLVAFIAFWVIFYYQGGVIENKQHPPILKKVKVANTALQNMIDRTNAINDWEKKLSKGRTLVTDPIMSIELENLWLGKRPILFQGAIRDISSLNKKQYRMVIDNSTLFLLRDGRPVFIGSRIYLRLKCDRTMIDSLLMKNPRLFKESGRYNVVLVVAKIDSIKSGIKENEEGDKIGVHTGVGSCVDIQYAGGSQIKQP